MDQRSLSAAISVARLFACIVLCAGASIASSQTVIFHETFDTNVDGEYGFDQEPVSFGSDLSSNGNNWSYWGIWDPSGSAHDFGSDAIPDAPSFVGYDGNALVGNRMNGGGNGGGAVGSVADPGEIYFLGVNALNFVDLEFSMDLAAFREPGGNGSGSFNSGDYVRVSWREAATVAWEDDYLLNINGLGLQNVGSSFVLQSILLTPNWAAVDFRVEMRVTGGREHVAIDNVKLLGCLDSDGDGICDDVDDCVGILDACGICNGPGEIYECGCDDIPAGDCDCEGNQLDVFGVCGGDCAADTDNDGICDDVDPCVGALDACGVCNGPGAVYECGCADIAEGECDCEGTLKEEVTININPDSFGSEITWSLLDDAGNEVASGGPYSDGNTGLIAVTTSLCPACYTFTIEDSYGDGLINGGNYSVVAGGQTLIQGTGDYGFGETGTFCIGTELGCEVTGSYSGDLAGLDFGSAILLPLAENAAFDSLTFALTFDGPGGDYWASDMAVVLTNPAGQCMTLEGSGTAALPACLPDAYEFWPSSWDSSLDGVYPYSYTGNLIGQVLGTEAGDWTVQVVNAWGDAMDRVSYNLTWTAYLNCSGCTDPAACNYDVTAGVDDGSCIDSDPVDGCCQSVGDACLSLSSGESIEVVQFVAEGVLETLMLDMDWTNVSLDDGNYPGAFGMIISSPNGSCVHFGEGSASAAPTGCVDAGGYTVYGDGWGQPSAVFGSSAAELEAEIDLSSFGLSGGGAWSITIVNGASGAGEVSYSVNWFLDYLCPLEGALLGCTDVLACNYESGVFEDGSCEYLSCGCAVSGSQMDTLSYDNWAGDGNQIVIAAGADPTLFLVDLDFTNVSGDVHGDGYVEEPNSWASDMVVSVVDANGNCAWWGGFNWFGAVGVSSPPNCAPEDELTGVSWDACWDVSASGQYSDAIDLSSAGLSGEGTWEVTVFNGWSWLVSHNDAYTDQHEGDAIYDVQWSLIGACSGSGCTDVEACNYDPNAIVDDGSCGELDVCGICEGDGSTCSGCTDELACNYDPEALFDDGSCDEIIDPVIGCCTYADTAIDVTLAGAGNEEVWTIEATSVGGLGEFELAIDFAPSGSMINWVSDILVSFIDPAGLCYYFGGNQFTEEGNLSPYLADNNCSSVTSGWPTSWNTNLPGPYSAVVDLSETDLSGNGTWEVAIHNGDINSSPASYSLVTWEVVGLCIVEACSDPAACNYTPNWTLADDSLCVYPGSCESCNADGSVILSDADGDGVCDDDEVTGCTDSMACNFNADPTVDEDNTLCDYCSCPGDNITSDNPLYGLEIDTVATDIGLISDGTNMVDLSGYSTYRLYVTTPNVDDFVSSVSGDAVNQAHLSTTTSFYNSPLGIGTPNALNPLIFAAYPSLEYDSWVTIGLDQVPDLVAGEALVATVQDAGAPWFTEFDPGGGVAGSNIVINSVVGGAWYALNGDSNGLAGVDKRVLLAQVTTNGALSGDLYCQILPNGTGDDRAMLSFVPGNACGCADVAACNFDPAAEHDDGSCYYPDACGICDGPGAIYECGCADIPEGDCDCNGNVLDECGVCGGSGIPAGDCDCNGNVLDECLVCGGSGIPAGDCDCNGNVLDECGVCGGTGIPEGDCDCFGNQLDACGVCGGAGTDVDGDGICDDIDLCTDTAAFNYAEEGNVECLYTGCAEPTADNYDPNAFGCLPDGSGIGCCIWYGCTDGTFGDGTPPACNYDPVATDDDGTCEYVTCEGCTEQYACNYDPDALIDDGSCDYSCQGCTNPCSANYDLGATVDDGSCQAVLGCMDTLACNFDCAATISYPSFCDYPDECGVCGGTGIPEGDCDCDGNQLDVLGVCGGNCLQDADGDGVCDWPVGCTDASACNYDADANSDDGSCEWCSCATLTLPDSTDLTAGTLDANIAGYALAGDVAGAFPNVIDPNGCFQFKVGTDECGTLSSVSVLEPGIQEVTLSVIFNGDTVSVDTELTVAEPVEVLTCEEPAACNYGLAPPCHYPGQQGDCNAPQDGYAFFKKLNQTGDGCYCDSMPGEQVWFESFGADGALMTASSGPGSGDLDFNGDNLLDAGYGYSGATDLSTIGPENTEWSISLPEDFVGDAPNFWGVDATVSDAYFSGLELNGNWMGWESSSISMQDAQGSFGKLAIQLHAEGVAVGEGDELEVNILSADSVYSGSVYGGDEWGAEGQVVLSDLMSAPESVQLEIRALNDGAGEEWRFDDITLFGWREGCTDERASNYDAGAAFENGSCEYVWDTICALCSGPHHGHIWLDSEIADGDAENVQAVELDLDETKVVRVQPSVDLIIDKTPGTQGLLRVKNLDIRNGASVFIPDSMTLEVMDPFNVAFGLAVKGPGRLKLSGGVDWSALDSSLSVASLRSIALDADHPIQVPLGKQLVLKGGIDFPEDVSMTIGGRVNLVGAENRSIRGKSPRFEHLTVELCDTETEVLVEVDTLIVKERLSMKRGGLNMDGHTLEFNSDTSGTGKLDAVSSEAALLGAFGQASVDAKVNRFIPPSAGNWGWTLFSGSALEGMVVSDLNGSEDFYTAGWPSSDYPNSTSTVQFWDEQTGSVAYPQGDNTPLDTLGGCWVVIYGSQNPTFKFSGPLRSHDVDAVKAFTITRSVYEDGVWTGSNVTAISQAGWNMIPNPYQARLDWHVLHENNADVVEDQYLIFNSVSQDFQRYSAGGLDSLQVNGNRYIEPGNSFWVRLKEGETSGTFEFPATAIDNASAGGPFVRADEEEDQWILLELENEFGSDYVKVVPSEFGSIGYVHGPDISYRSSAVQQPKIALYSENNLYAAKSLPRSFERALYLRSSGQNEVTMRVVKAPDEMCGSVVDAVTGQVLDLVVGEEMSFTLAQTVSAYERFMLAVHDFARTEAVMPSCPESADGKVAVHVGDGVTANMSLLSPEGVVLDQLLGVEEAAEFTAVQPGEYTVVVTGVAGTVCPKSQREVIVPPGEQPELLGLNWSAPPCNEGTIEIDFELYGGGTFGWMLFGEDGIAQQGAGAGEMVLTGMAPGGYVLNVDHACLQESVEFEAVDSDAPVVDWEADEVVVANEDGTAVIEAFFTGTADAYRWYLANVMIGNNAPLAYDVFGEGVYAITLEAERNGCTATETFDFSVVSAQRGEAELGWKVSMSPGGWLIQSEVPWSTLQWSLVDGAGRLVSAGRETEGHQLRMVYPIAAGTYRLTLTTGTERSVVSLLAPQR